MAELKSVSTDAFNWLNGNDPSQWSKSHFSFCKSDMLLSNLSECFNKTILEARDKLILTLMEMVRTKIMQKITVKKEEANKYTGSYFPKYKLRLNWQFNKPLVIEPKFRRPPGRPKKKRVKEVKEPSNSTGRFTKRGATIYCSKCHKAGHNQRTCKGEVGGNIPVNALRRTTNQRTGASVSESSVSLPKLPIMVIDFKLTYPSGTATAHLINSFHTPQGAKLAK
ncbi:hypothetical protein V6N13_148563 [Hibiscus sabdariffa]